MRNRLRRMSLVSALLGGGLLTAACDPSGITVSTGVSVGADVYYDSMLWNDYYYNRPVPPRPPRPGPGPRPPRPGPGPHPGPHPGPGPHPHPMPHPHPPIHRG